MDYLLLYSGAKNCQELLDVRRVKWTSDDDGVTQLYMRALIIRLI